ncbi:rhomboid family intramembrane serine protease [Maritalea myrionectae]|uniref:rhomboid family intramembrane serine protease n=1 Tax=Maritalea myrionectae TaxID=454601 RepID=UPI0003F54F13|nr:rhomboid family intramembrane serine protease [Maritalea myrionectae]
MFLPLYDQNPKRFVIKPYVNYALILLTTFLFTIQYLLPVNAENYVIATFGMVPYWLSDARIDQIPFIPDEFTFVTYAFLHGDWLHLLSNMLFLWVFGDNIEDALGHFRYLLFYLLCAAGGGALHYFVYQDDLSPLVGASGAVAGVIGAYILLYPKVRVYVLARIIIPLPLPIPALWVLGAWIAMQIFYVILPQTSAVAWWAHIGGVIAGMLLVLLFKRPEVRLFQS